MSVRLLTNLYCLENVHMESFPTRIARYRGIPRGIVQMVQLYRQLLMQDYVLINCAPSDLLFVCFVKLSNPLIRCRIISLDTVLPVPHVSHAVDGVRLWLKRLLFKQVHLFIEYFKDTRGYEHYYHIPARKFRYVPFKINRYERVLGTQASDQGYIFCGGNTRRDFATLIEAVRGLDYPVRIVTMANTVIEGHGSFLDESQLPANVQVVRHDGSDSFIDHIAGARLVALPVKKENISASGIGVYIASMALGKCVIISRGPAVNGVIPDGSAIVVPPEDVRALREAIVQAYTNDEYRHGFARIARAYALSLEGEERLCASVMKVIADDHGVPVQSGGPII